MDDPEELARVRRDLDRLVSRRLMAPFTAEERARFDALGDRELYLLAEAARGDARVARGRCGQPRA